MNKTKGVVRVGNLSLASTKDSNLFLRALWAVLRSKYGKLGWHYTPRRLGDANRISFGYMSLGAVVGAGQIEVSIEYKVCGVIRNICFDIDDCTVSPPKELENCLKNSVSEAREFMQNPDERTFRTYVTTSTGAQLAPYHGQHWKCIPINDNLMEISIEVKGFDGSDCEQEFVSRLDQLLDAFALMTNVLFSMAEKVSTEEGREPEAANIYLIEEDWLDGCSIEGGYLRLACSQVEYCDRLVAGTVESDQTIKAARLFHHGLRLSKQALTNNDIAETLFVSAIEAISFSHKESEKCETCRQPKFSISQRVSEVAGKHLGEHIAKIFKQYYSNRSKFLHTGHVRASLPMTSHVFPQLDPSGVEGCSVPLPFGCPKNLLEFTSFILRREIELIDSCARTLPQ